MDARNLAKNLIEKCENILIFPSPEFQGDSLGPGLALFYILKKLGKNVNIDLGNISEKFKFLTNGLQAATGDFMISVKTEGKKISQIRYEKNDKDLKIYLSLNGGRIENNDISFAPARLNLLIAVGAQSLENIPQNLWGLPILNIDNQPQNENFGEVNLTELTDTLSEITINLIETLSAQELLDEESATCLLSGIIWSSQNFRNPKTRPKTFDASAFLIEKGANHQKIIQHLYNQKNIPQIKLLGKILENLCLDESKEIYSAALKEDDFRACQANSKDLSFALEELKFHFRRLPNLLILWESHASPPLIKGIFYSANPGYAEKIMENFEGDSKGGGALFLIRETDLKNAKEKVLNIL